MPEPVDVTERFPSSVGDFRHLQGPGSEHRGSILRVVCGPALNHMGHGECTPGLHVVRGGAGDRAVARPEGFGDGGLPGCAEDTNMNDRTIARITGAFGLACVGLTFGQFPLWLVGSPPSVYDGRAFAHHLFDIKNVAFTRILMDQGIYVSMLVFAAGLRHLIRQARSETEWIGTLLFGAALGWVAVTVVADGLEGGAVLATLNGNPDPSTVRALVAGTLLIYNGSIAFAITGLFLGSAAWATFDSRVLPRWTGWIAVAGAVLCAAAVPAMYGGPVNYTGFYNAGGWGPAIVANFPPMIWFLMVSVILIRRPGIGHGASVRAA